MPFVNTLFCDLSEEDDQLIDGYHDRLIRYSDAAENIAAGGTAIVTVVGTYGVLKLAQAKQANDAVEEIAYLQKKSATEKTDVAYIYDENSVALPNGTVMASKTSYTQLIKDQKDIIAHKDDVIPFGGFGIAAPVACAVLAFRMAKVSGVFNNFCNNVADTVMGWRHPQQVKDVQAVKSKLNLLDL